MTLPKRAFAALPGIGISLLPKLTCPLCWPAYAGLLSTVGLGFLIPARNLLLVTSVFLTASTATLSFRAKTRHGYRPALLSLVAATIILFGKFSIESQAVMYSGLGLLVAASLWNGWPRRPAGSCPQCAPNGDEIIQLSAKEK